jgi:hypothetical protein
VSLGVLRALSQRNAFKPTPVHELAAVHVPFDELVAAGRTEARLGEAVRAGKRVALVGERGGGKSSVAEWVLHDPPLAAIDVPVAGEPDETVTDPKAFAQHLVQRTARYAQEALALPDEERETLLRRASDRVLVGNRQTTLRLGAAVKLWLLQPDVAREVSETLSGDLMNRSTAEVLDVVDDLIALVKMHDLQPVIVIDDSDRWLRESDRRHLVKPFFRDTFRVLAERSAALVVAVHRDYYDVADLTELTDGMLELPIEVPALEAVDQLGRILDRRMQHAEFDPDHRQAFEPAAVVTLFEHYEGKANGSIRQTLGRVQQALDQAVQRGDDIVTVHVVKDVLTDPA